MPQNSPFNTLPLAMLGGIGLRSRRGISWRRVALRRQRTQETMCVRRSAQPVPVAGLILRGSLKPVGLGAALGLLAAVAATRLLAAQLVDVYGVSRTDPLTIALVAATLIAVALVASAVPAKRAAAIDPTTALAAE
jgi:putative ABC transport system permease protein